MAGNVNLWGDIREYLIANGPSTVSEIASSFPPGMKDSIRNTLTYMEEQGGFVRKVGRQGSAIVWDYCGYDGKKEVIDRREHPGYARMGRYVVHEVKGDGSDSVISDYDDPSLAVTMTKTMASMVRSNPAFGTAQFYIIDTVTRKRVTVYDASRSRRGISDSEALRVLSGNSRSRTNNRTPVKRAPVRRGPPSKRPTANRRK